MPDSESRNAGWARFDQVDSQRRWSPENFERVVQELLTPLVDNPRHAAVGERLLRYYMTHSLVSRPDRDGLMPVYTWRHLAEVVSLRVLMDRRATVRKLKAFLPELTPERRLELARSESTEPIEEAYRTSGAYQRPDLDAYALGRRQKPHRSALVDEPTGDSRDGRKRRRPRPAGPDSSLAPGPAATSTAPYDKGSGHKRTDVPALATLDGRKAAGPPGYSMTPEGIGGTSGDIASVEPGSSFELLLGPAATGSSPPVPGPVPRATPSPELPEDSGRGKPLSLWSEHELIAGVRLQIQAGTKLPRGKEQRHSLLRKIDRILKQMES